MKRILAVIMAAAVLVGVTSVGVNAEQRRDQFVRHCDTFDNSANTRHQTLCALINQHFITGDIQGMLQFCPNTQPVDLHLIEIEHIRLQRQLNGGAWTTFLDISDPTQVTCDNVTDPGASKATAFTNCQDQYYYRTSSQFEIKFSIDGQWSPTYTLRSSTWNPAPANCIAL